jgi:hypothetical protein
MKFSSPKQFFIDLLSGKKDHPAMLRYLFCSKRYKIRQEDGDCCRMIKRNRCIATKEVPPWLIYGVV